MEILQRVIDDLFATSSVGLDEEKEALDIDDFFDWASKRCGGVFGGGGAGGGRVEWGKGLGLPSMQAWDLKKTLALWLLTRGGMSIGPWHASSAYVQVSLAVPSPTP
jgi:hypothetical protein